MTRLISLDNNLLNMPLGGGASEFDFDGVERNLALDAMAKKAGVNELVPKATSTGTTIVASVYKDGVIVGADSRSTAGHLISNKSSMKLHRLTDSIYAGGAGTAADLQKVTEMIAAELKLFELNNEGKKARVLMAHRRLRQYLFQYQGYVGAYLLIGGVDFKGPHLYEVHASGGGYNKPFSADGSGSYCAIAEMEDNFKPNMTEQECRNMVIKALEAGMHGDNMSGNTYNLVTITANGKRLEGPFIPSFAKRPELEGDYKMAPGTTTVLKTKKLENMGTACFGEIPRESAKSDTPMET